MSDLLSDYYTREEAAAALLMTTRTLHKYTNVPDGIPSVRFGGNRLMYRKEAVREWLIAREKKGA